MTAGFFLAGIAIAITGVSYSIYMEFTYQWLVWVLAGAFVAVGLMTMEWPRGFRNQGEVPEGKLRQFLLVSMPLAFIVSSQVCGLGLRACNIVCHTTNLLLIVLAAVTAIRLHRGQTIGAVLVPMIIIALLPHCVCFAPINILWHRMMGGYAPTCEMMPLAAVLYSVAALRGVRPQLGTGLVVLLFVVMIFIIVGSILFGFPWQGCVDHPNMTG
jgi:hypothetical protein